MTVAELIKHLQKFPSETLVMAYDATEGYSELGPDGIEYEENEIRDEGNKLIFSRRIVHLIGSDGA